MSKKQMIKALRKHDGVAREFTREQWENLVATNHSGNYRVISGGTSNARPIEVSKEILDIIESQENAEQTNGE